MGCWKTTIAALLFLLSLQQSNGTYFHYPYFHYPYFHYLECLCIVQCRRSCIDLDNDDTFVCDIFSAVTGTKWVLDAFDRQDDNYCVPENWKPTDYSNSSDPLPFEGPVSPWTRHTQHIPFWRCSCDGTVTITNTHTVNAYRRTCWSESWNQRDLLSPQNQVRNYGLPGHILAWSHLSDQNRIIPEASLYGR